MTKKETASPGYSSRLDQLQAQFVSGGNVPKDWGIWTVNSAVEIVVFGEDVRAVPKCVLTNDLSDLPDTDTMLAVVRGKDVRECRYFCDSFTLAFEALSMAACGHAVSFRLRDTDFSSVSCRGLTAQFRLDYMPYALSLFAVALAWKRGKA